MKTVSNFPQLAGMVLVLLTLHLNAQVSLNLKVFLEGPFNGTAMNTDLNTQNLIPLNQPYNVVPWNYTGTEQVSSIPNPDIVDWLMVELRETTGDASTATPDKMINRQAAFLKENGNIVGTDGNNMLIYSGSVTSNLYIIICHRNHLAIMSSGPLTETGGIYSWDFTDQLSKAYLDGQKDISGGNYGLIGGDCNASGRINKRDEDINWSRHAGKSGYDQSDINLDTQVNNIDKDEIWFSNIGRVVQLPEGVVFFCGAELQDDRDGKIYFTEPIATQCWLAENLNIGTMIQGTTEMTNNSIIEKYCHSNSTTNCTTYGGIYQWNEMMQYVTTPGVQGICPASWHLPTDAEWTILTTFLSGESVAGGKMKEIGTLHWNSPNTGATNSSGFTALPGGCRLGNGNFAILGLNAYFWSSNTSSTNRAWNRILNYNVTNAYRSDDYKAGGFSVRCVKD